MLTQLEMLNIEGGKINWSIVSFVGGVIALIAGIVDGILRPQKCPR